MKKSLFGFNGEKNMKTQVQREAIKEKHMNDYYSPMLTRLKYIHVNYYET